MISECSICFEIVRSSETQKPFATLCGHIFHENCINSCLDNQNKCPQCNQYMSRSTLIRLFPNQPEISVDTKDQMIKGLKRELNELHEKAQLQYDLIASLNRHINVLIKELSATRKSIGYSQSTLPTSTGSAGLPSQNSTISGNIFENIKTTNSAFSFEGTNSVEQHVPASSSLMSTSSAPSTQFQSIPNDVKRELCTAFERMILGTNDLELSKRFKIDSNSATGSNLQHKAQTNIFFGSSATGSKTDSNLATASNLQHKAQQNIFFGSSATGSKTDSNLATGSNLQHKAQTNIFFGSSAAGSKTDSNFATASNLQHKAQQNIFFGSSATGSKTDSNLATGSNLQHKGQTNIFFGSSAAGSKTDSNFAAGSQLQHKAQANSFFGSSAIGSNFTFEGSSSDSIRNKPFDNVTTAASGFTKAPCGGPSSNIFAKFKFMPVTKDSPSTFGVTSKDTGTSISATTMTGSSCFNWSAPSANPFSQLASNNCITSQPLSTSTATTKTTSPAVNFNVPSISSNNNLFGCTSQPLTTPTATTKTTPSDVNVNVPPIISSNLFGSTSAISSISSPSNSSTTTFTTTSKTSNANGTLNGIFDSMSKTTKATSSGIFGSVSQSPNATSSFNFAPTNVLTDLQTSLESLNRFFGSIPKSTVLSGSRSNNSPCNNVTIQPESE